jgi:micrococcal nuclease
VLDGDSLRCADGREIRLLLIDAPEWGQAPWGDLARAVLVDLAPPGSSLDVVYDIQRTDSFGRDLAYLYQPGGAMVNERMAWLGYAVALVIPPNGLHEDQIRAAVSSALAEERGLWAEWKFACLPVDYRAGRCS